MSAQTIDKKGIRWDVFIPCFLIIGGAAILGVVNNAWRTKVNQAVFGWSLETFGWLYQWVALGTLILITLLAFSPLGKIRFGGPQAKAKFSFGAWFAMTHTGGIATGLITYGVNEPLIYYGSMAQKYIIMLRILSQKKDQDLDVATMVSVLLQLTDPDLKSRDRVVKKTEKDRLYKAMDVAKVWLDRALSTK